ncbi:hypothetical protein [Catenisphaera adipataccumulans]|jgi:hypothetical protein|uniref:Uncharacterized protein n=1 Tax=Catenisphaera adipataccumulans TaxID=700500 RepID=A0A7W8FY01_9FIRM|nr:hypothetical protein [Catenisphaera adipataccumulans]MBB5183502.1 hypothetical protein [Catenisphaera adipataccumulans]
MNKKKKFAYDVELGAVMDYVEDHFMLVIKDEDWNEEELELLKAPIDLHFCYTQDIAIFVLEGGDIDSSDFYFNVQDCDWKDQLLASDQVDVEVILLNKKNEICWSRRKTLNPEQSRKILDCIRRQAETTFMPGEYDVNVQGIQSAYEPYELNKFAVVSIRF